ncbi:MAG TPA: hypothetical protein PK156_48795 [Polyangium sp.]|nr:hypothetical protein [Polyangium sp.]
MYRAWQRFVIALPFALSSALFLPKTAWAYHSGSTFDKPPGAGGGGGIFYAGAPLERGWDCTMCHLDPPGKVRVKLDVNPPSLFQNFTYSPGAVYSFTATMLNEQLGKNSPLSNYNSVAVEVVDGKGYQAGSMGGFAAEDLYSGYPATIVTTGTKPNVTQWTFTWTAPPMGTGGVTMHVAGVDGNGANAGAGKTLTDPLNDDVFVAAVSFTESPMGQNAPGFKPLHPTRSGALACALGIVFAVGSSRRRARRSS